MHAVAASLQGKAGFQIVEMRFQAVNGEMWNSSKETLWSEDGHLDMVFFGNLALL